MPLSGLAMGEKYCGRTTYTDPTDGGGAVTVTVADALFDVSALLVATTWYVPAVAGAV